MKNEVNKLGGEAELLNKTSDAIYVCSMYNVITVWNRGAEKMFGWLEVIALNCHKRANLQECHATPLALRKEPNSLSVESI